jgi:acyl-CoA dehydrogenase
VHQGTVARQLLRGYSPSPDLWPTEYIPALRAQAEAGLLGTGAAE